MNKAIWLQLGGAVAGMAAVLLVKHFEQAKKAKACREARLKSVERTGFPRERPMKVRSKKDLERARRHWNKLKSAEKLMKEAGDFGN